MAQVVLEDVYKSYPSRQGEPTPGRTRDAAPLSSPEAALPLPEKPASAQAVSVLRRINLSVNDGEFMVLVGPSGCGKSTLLRLIAGLEALTAGNIWVGDRRVNDLPPKQRDIAMVFQSYALYPHMSVYENLAFGLRRTPNSLEPEGLNPNLDKSYRLQALAEKLLAAATRSLPPPLRYRSLREQAIDQRVRQVAQMLQIEMLLQRLPKQLSGGQKQRVALGRAMARNPQVFLMDEPLSNLDAKLRAETRTQIVNLQRQLGTTTLYVTHDQTEAMTMGDRIAVMNGGQIQQLATPLELYHHPANRFVAEFIGTPPMNFLPVVVKAPLLLHHSQLQLQLPETWGPLLQPYLGRSLLLGVRPEHLELAPPLEPDLRVQVERVEALGHETYLTVSPRTSAPGPTLHWNARIAADAAVQLGEQIGLKIQIPRIHLFDADTGLALS